jgi:uncharacterized protein (TIGR02271 family)
VVTQHRQVGVPVSHEELTLEREPITKTNRGQAYDGPAISEEEHEVTLHAERPMVDTEAVAVEGGAAGQAKFGRLARYKVNVTAALRLSAALGPLPISPR